MSPLGSPRPGCPYVAGAPLLVAHRGGSRLAPENTMVAFAAAVRAWDADMLEMDVRLTRDGRLVVIHDELVDRTTDGVGPVSSFSLAELQGLDAGHRFVDLQGETSFRGKGVRVPLFEEVLKAFPGTRLNVESKEPEAAAPLVDIILRNGAQDRVLVAAAGEARRRSARGYPGPWGASRRHILLFWALHHLPGNGPYTPGADILQVPEVWRGMRIVTPGLVKAAHRRNLPVQVWTVDDSEDMRRLLSWGVDGIQSDRPDLLAAILVEKYGRPPPPGLMERGNGG